MGCRGACLGGGVGEHPVVELCPTCRVMCEIGGVLTNCKDKNTHTEHRHWKTTSNTREERPRTQSTPITEGSIRL